MKFEKQLDRLSRIGLTLADGVTVDDLLYSYKRRDYEREPFDLILFVLGINVERAPWGRPICRRVWNFDAKCISDFADYETIVARLCEVAGKPGCLTDVRAFFDADTNEARLEYRAGNTQRRWPLNIDYKWADTRTLLNAMADIESDGYRFFYKDNHRAMILFYLDNAAFKELDRLINGMLYPVLETKRHLRANESMKENDVYPSTKAEGETAPWWQFLKKNL